MIQSDIKTFDILFPLCSYQTLTPRFAINRLTGAMEKPTYRVYMAIGVKIHIYNICISIYVSIYIDISIKILHG